MVSGGNVVTERPPQGTVSPVSAAVWGERVRLERSARGWTQAELGDMVGVSRDTIVRIESDRATRMPDELRLDLADAFALDAHVLFPYRRPERRRRHVAAAA